MSGWGFPRAADMSCRPRTGRIRGFALRGTMRASHLNQNSQINSPLSASVIKHTSPSPDTHSIRQPLSIPRQITGTPTLFPS
jgi:hypothetical protein